MLLNHFPVPMFARASIALLLVAFCVALSGCPPAPPPGDASLPKVNFGAEASWSLSSAKGQTSYLPLDLPEVVTGSILTIGRPMRMVAAGHETAGEGSSVGRTPSQGSGNSHPLIAMPAESWTGRVSVYAARLIRGAAEGPLAAQLTGMARTPIDAGSFLVALPAASESRTGPDADAVATRCVVRDPMPLYLKVEVPPTVEPGEYRFAVRLETPTTGGAAIATESILSLEVADIALPSEPRVLAIATTTMTALSRIYPADFDQVPGGYLDRSVPEHHAAVDRLDALVRRARAEGVALFVEDLAPLLRVDELGKVTLDWDAYDRVMQPYMDGAAFADHIPLAVWMAPAPPRRIRDSMTQLWQYIDACARHFEAKRWVGTPVFFHPAMVTPRESEELRAQVADAIERHLPRDMLAVTSLDAPVPHGQIWAMQDEDPRLPPAGILADEHSVRAWPWVCIARGNTRGGSPSGVKGFLWRDAVAGAEAQGGSGTGYPLLVDNAGEILPSLRMMWLRAGLNDAALLGLLERRSDPGGGGVVSEALAGMVGRTGIGDSIVGGDIPIAPAGFLYAGWPTDRMRWERLVPLLQRLILAADPGTRAAVRSDDPLYLAARIWLAQSYRPVARIGGYSFSRRQSLRGGDILDVRLHLLLENPSRNAAEMDLRFSDLPGDFAMAPQASTDGSSSSRSATLEASAAVSLTVPLAGHVNALMASPAVSHLDLSERQAGALLRLPVQFPIYRTRALEVDAPTPNLDGHADDWPMDNQLRVFGEMKVATRYLTRPDLLSGTLREEPPATVRWTYDREYLYFLARCPQDAVSDERTTAWPLRRGIVAATGAGEPPQVVGGAGPQEEGARWWGSDGLQIHLASMATPSPAAPTLATDALDRVVWLALKPSGIVLLRTGQVQRDPQTGRLTLTWRDGPPAVADTAAPGIRYGISIERQEGRPVAYIVEGAIPRAWIDGPASVPGSAGVVPAAASVPAWRVNVLRHRAADLVSTSWSGPLVGDNDVAMMGVLLGE